jgi:excisionase family DNA binding protein
MFELDEVEFRPMSLNGGDLQSQVEVESAPSPPADRLLTAAEAATYCGVHRNTIYEAAKAGQLRFRPIGRLRRFTREDIDDWTRGEAS